MTSIETMPGVSPKARAAYKLKVVSFNVQQLLAAQAREGKNQTEMASYLGIKPSGMSLKISRANWRFEEVLLAAEYLDTTVDELSNDAIMRMMLGNKKADQMLMDINTEKATGNTPMASNELLRLGLNQRPSDIRFWLAAVGLFATGVDNTPALLFLQIGVSSRMFALQLVFRRSSARNAQ